MNFKLGRNRIAILLVLILVSTFVIPNFVFAAILPASTSSGSSTLIISPGEYNEINDQNLTDKCNVELSNRLYKIPFNWGLFNSGLTKIFSVTIDSNATWLVARWDDKNKCTIYQKKRIGAFDTNGPDYFAAKGYRIESEKSWIALQTKGDYYLERTPFAIDVQVTLMNTSAPITTDQIREKYEGSNFDDLSSGTSKVVGWAINALLSVINSFFLWISALAGTVFVTALDWILSSTYPNIITVGWTIVRDICNMFFILILIVISLASILRIEKYNYKTLLSKVVLMAILVNFSLVIAMTIIHVFDMLTAVFAPRNASEIWAYVYKYIAFGDLGTLPNGWMAGMVQGLSKLAFTAVSTVVFLALTLMFVIRTIGLYVLVIFSPIAYVGSILPATEKFAQQWWSTFFKYLIWAPIALFMLKLAMLLPQSKEFTASDSAFNYLIIVGFLAASFIVAQQAGMIGSKQVIGFGKKVGTVLGGGLAGFAGQAYSKAISDRIEAAKAANKNPSKFLQLAQYANLRVAKEAWQARVKRKEEEAYMPAVGNAQDTLNRMMPAEWGKNPKTGKWELGEKTHYGRIAQQALVNKKIKEWTDANLTEEEKNLAIQQARDPVLVEALEAVHIKGRHEDGDEISMALEERKKREEEIYNGLIKAGRSKDDARIIAQKQAETEVAAEFDAVDHLDTTTDRMKEAGLTREQIASRLGHMDEIGEAEQKIRAIGNQVTEYDGQARAANDLSGYAKMEQEMGSAAMLQSLANLELSNTTALKQNVKDAAGNDMLDKDGKVIQKVTGLQMRDNNGNVIAEVKNYADLEAAIGKTTTKGMNGKNKIAARNNGSDVRYNIIGARKNQSADKRMKRGDSERWAKAHEPAAYMVQDENGKFTRFTSFGAKRFAAIDGAAVNGFKKTRGIQSRVAKLAGIYQDPKTGKAGFADMNLEAMEQALRLNKEFTEAIIGKSDLDDGDIKKIIAHMATKGIHIDEADIAPAR